MQAALRLAERVRLQARTILGRSANRGLLSLRMIPLGLEEPDPVKNNCPHTLARLDLIYFTNRPGPTTWLRFQDPVGGAFMCSLRTWLAALAGLLAAGSWLSAENKKGPQPACKVAYQDLHLKVIVNGVVDVKDDHAVKSEVKAGSRGRPEIKWIVANGSQVKKGDLIVEMDDSYLQELVLQRKIDYFRAKSDVTAAELYLPIKKACLSWRGSRPPMPTNPRRRKWRRPSSS